MAWQISNPVMTGLIPDLERKKVLFCTSMCKTSEGRKENRKQKTMSSEEVRNVEKERCNSYSYITSMHIFLFSYLQVLFLNSLVIFWLSLFICHKEVSNSEKNLNT